MIKTGQWSAQERVQLKDMVKQGLTPEQIGPRLNRSPRGVRRVINKLSLSPEFNKAMLEGAARRCFSGKRTIKKKGRRK